jgi:hypothetical protein
MGLQDGPSGELELRCDACGWVPGILWNAWEAHQIRREPNGTYTVTCPGCGAILIERLTYQGQR